MDSVIKKSGLLGWPNSTYPLGNEFIFETSMASYVKDAKRIQCWRVYKNKWLYSNLL